MRPRGLDREFTVIGENIHTTRVLLRTGTFVVAAPSGEESVRYTTANGETRYLIISESFKSRQDYLEGRVKHVMIAVKSAMSDSEPAASEGMTYLRAMVEKQIRAGADFLDLNVDEISLRPEEQKAAMRWLVRQVESMSSVPLCIDSSNLEIILTGIEACERKAGPPMLNSASLERIDALDLAKDRGLPVVVTAAGESGMPQNAEERIEKASRIVDTALQKNIPLNRMYIDPLVFPISVDGEFGNHCLGAIRQLRSKYGPEIHMTGGLSNVSFGLPCRKLINEVFINLAVDAGADGGIVDPVANRLDELFLADKESAPYRLAEDMLLGRDRNCKAFLRAFRKGELTPAAAVKQAN